VYRRHGSSPPIFDNLTPPRRANREERARLRRRCERVLPRAHTPRGSTVGTSSRRTRERSARMRCPCVASSLRSDHSGLGLLSDGVLDLERAVALLSEREVLAWLRSEAGRVNGCVPVVRPHVEPFDGHLEMFESP
jgi:hypothetical protein